MKKIIEVSTESQAVSQLVQKTLYQIATEGARQMLGLALAAEVDTFLTQHSGLKMADGRQRVVKNGHHSERSLILPTGAIPVSVPRTRDRGGDAGVLNFHSAIVPPYLRRATDLDEFIPFLYLKGISTNDFSDVLSKLVGHNVNLSASTVVRLKESWESEYQSWQKRDLSGKQYVYFWADGIYIKSRLDDEKACVLCIIGATAAGQKELVAIQAGYRESELSWRELLIDLKKYGLLSGPTLAIGDGALGFWKALRQEFPETREQRCWVHKMRNVLDKLPDSLQVAAKNQIHEIYQAPTKADALSVFEKFVRLHEDKYPKAVACLQRDKDATLTFYDFPAAHWVHIRSTNVIESLFATVRLRTHKTKGAGNQTAAMTMVFKLAESAQRRWRKLRGHNIIPLVIAGETFVDGELKKAA